MNKQHILQEIQRTAAQNGGVPLGRLRFLQETGIKESDWSGKIWARWNDAIREAGFLPNEMKGSFTDEFLLEQYATLVLELGHIPTGPEVRLHCRQDSEFPHLTTFERFGTKRELLAKLHAFTQIREHFHAVAALCEPPVIVDKGESEESVTKADEVFGFVYLIKAGGHYKIGKTNSVGRRERELAIQLPDKSKTVHFIRTDDPPGIEDYWHRRFEAKRKNGEWFDLSAQDVAAFRRRKFM